MSSASHLNDPMSAKRRESLLLEAFESIVEPRELELSPSGKRVVYTLAPALRTGDRDVSAVWVAEVGMHYSAGLVIGGLSKNRSPKWSPASECIAFISNRANPGESDAIYTIKIGQDAVPITDTSKKKTITSFSWSPNGDWIAWLSPDEDSPEERARRRDKDDEIIYHTKWDYNRLRCLHVRSGQSTTLFQKACHVHNFAWSRDSSYITCVTHHTPDRDSSSYQGSSFELIDVRQKTVSNICTFPGPTYGLDWSTAYLYFIAGVSPDKGNTSRMVYRMDVDRKRQWEEYRFGDCTCAENLRGLSVAPAVKVQDGLWDKLVIISEPSDELLYSTENEISGWDVVMCREEIPALVVAKSSCIMPTEVFSVHEGRTIQLSRHHEPFGDILCANAEAFFVTAKDGARLDGVLIRPSNAEDRSWPTIVALHGGPYGRVNLGFGIPHFYWGPWLAAAGYAVLCPNFRGGSSHGETFASSARGGVGTQDYDDIITFVKEGIERGVFDEHKVAIGGWSQGGFLSYLASTRPDFHFRAAVCGAGVTDWDMLVMSSDYPFYEAELAGGSPWSTDPNDTRGRSVSPVWHMKNITTPMLIFHGEKDQRVPVSQAIAFYRGCLHYKIDCEMILYPREGHFIVERNHRMNMLKRVKDFYDRHLGA